MTCALRFGRWLAGRASARSRSDGMSDPRGPWMLGMPPAPEYASDQRGDKLARWLFEATRRRLEYEGRKADGATVLATLVFGYAPGLEGDVRRLP